MHEKLHEMGDRPTKPTVFEEENQQDRADDKQIAEIRARGGQLLGRKIRRGSQIFYRCDLCSTTAKVASELYQHAR